MNHLHSGAKWLFRFSAYFSFGIIGIFLGFWVIAPIGFVLFSIMGAGESIFAMVYIFSIVIYFVFVIAISEVYVRMAYNRWLFEFTNTNLKKEHGIIWKTYSNIPYERVQNVDIRRGIMARIFGFSSVMIQTAGYSAVGHGAGAEGYIPAVSPESAEKIRDFLMHKISKKGGSSGGLG
jgi:membrane protein YdbS with pleckstrin-like domain